MTHTTEHAIERDIRELISFAIMDGQNQIHDLKDGTATPEEVNERMFKSLDYFTDKATNLISDQVAKARIDELIGVRGWTEYEPDPKYSPAERFHIVPYTYLTKRIEELKRSKE